MNKYKYKLSGWLTAVWLIVGIVGILAVPTTVQADGTPVIEYMPLYARTGATDTPFAIYLTVSNLNENTNYEFTARIHHAGTDRGSFTTSGNFGTAYASLGTTPGGCGTNCSLSTWVYMRATATVPTGASNIRIRTRVVGAGTPSPDDLPGPTFLNMSTNGGWLEESVGTTRDGRAVAVYDGANLVGLYVAKLNGVTDGYANDPGYYRVAVPDCTDCGYTVETWELDAPGTPVGQINTMGANDCPNTVGVGAVQSLNACSTPTAVTLQGIQANGVNLLFVLLALIPLIVGTGFVIWRRRLLF